MLQTLLKYTLALSLLGPGIAQYSAPVDELDLLTGQHVIYSYNYTEPGPPDQLIKLIRAGLVGGVLLYDIHVNDNTPAAMAELLAAYKASPAHQLLRKRTGKDTSLLIMTNQEGGVFKGVQTYGPNLTAREVGQAPNPGAAGSQAGREAVDGLKAYNFNVNLAPVLGVYREPGNFLDEYGRSYGNTTKQVINAAIPFIRAQRTRGILVSIKHFPGLGAAAKEQNTDLGPVTLDVPLSDLKSIDTVTFATALRSGGGGVDMVMPSWAVYPAVDDLPAGLSEKWMKGWLRERFGFRGVTITEAMEAGAILPYGDVSARAKMAFRAGNDLILASQLNVTEGVEIQRALAHALRTGELNRRDFDAATKRIAELRSRTWN
ncbi:putative secreted glycosyl hydrolase [Cladobotryum mycophilum]|uniref:Secreted glycosyl hydrolase n=1 Tax=Cladobotryum mycophilum TaxID=491253 RepID=A0ABR0S634_9HYPO